MDTRMTVGERIRLVRQGRDMTQKELGERSGIAEPTIRRYEIGKLHPKYEALLSIAKALDCNVQFLLDGSYAVNVSDGVIDKLRNELAQWCAKGNGDDAQAVSFTNMLNGATFVLHRLGIPCKIHWNGEKDYCTALTLYGKTVHIGGTESEGATDA